MPNLWQKYGTGIRTDAPSLTAESWAAFCAKYRLHPNLNFAELPLVEQQEALTAAGALARKEERR